MTDLSATTWSPEVAIMAKRRRPRPFDLADIHVRVIRGPHKDNPEQWYWQARRTTSSGGREAVWCGWGTQAQVTKAIAPILAGAEPKRRAPDVVERVQDLLEIWLAWQLDREDISQGTKDRTAVECRHLDRLIGDVWLQRMNKGVIEDDYQTIRLREGAATGTIANEISTLVQAWRWGQSPKRDIVPAFRLEKPRLKHVPKLSRYVQTREEFWAAVDKIRPSKWWVRLVVLVIGSTGCRVMGIGNAVWADLHPERGTITVTEKGQPPRDARIPREIVAELLAHRPADAEPTDKIIPRTLRTIREETRTEWKRACEAAGVRHVTPRKIRTMVENLLFDAGADPGVVSAQLGHTPEVSLRHYRAAKASRVDEVMDLAGLGRRPDPDVIDLAERRRAKGGGS